MFQLMLTLIAIALTAAAAVASVNYLPWWHKAAGQSEQLMSRSLASLERGFDAVGRAMDGSPPDPTAEQDGGLMAYFGRTIGFRPAAVPGYAWTYGKANGGPYGGYHYFCMHPAAEGAHLSEASWRGVLRARAQYSPQQILLGAACGAHSDTVGAPGQALSVTMYVVAHPAPGGVGE